MRVAVVAEYYPRPSHPGLGIWAHRQALAARAQGIDVEVIALERPVPPLHALRSLAPGGGGLDAGPLREWLRGVKEQPRDATLDGVHVRYVRFFSPPRPISYGRWGRWAGPAVGHALDELSRAGSLDLLHAHYAVPAGDACRRWMGRRGVGLPLVVSVHGGDLTYAAPRSRTGRETVASTLRAANAVMVNSELTRQGVEDLIGHRPGLHVVHLGADVIDDHPEPHPEPTLVTVANLERRKSQGDVIRALPALGERHPRLRYILVGKGAERRELERLAASLGVENRVEFRGALTHEQTVAELARCHLHVMASYDEPFGVAHIEAMGAGVPAIGGKGTGAEDIARAGDGIVLVEPGDSDALARVIDELLSDPERRRALGKAARKTVAEHFSWERNGELTAAVYRESMKSS
jgi:teichuronic acid biosynthesis glycosyltransferase TuaC